MRRGRKDFQRQLALVSWHEILRDCTWVMMRRGTGEVAWWHTCKGEYGNNPGDYNRERNVIVCRTCGKERANDTICKLTGHR